MELFVAVFLVLWLTAAGLWYIWRERQMSVFARLGIPGPKPHLIYGNLKELMKKGSLVCHPEWFEKYGKIIGIYIGGMPVLLTSDHELLKMVQVKEFQDFSYRKSHLAGSFLPDRALYSAIVLDNGPRWKIIRTILSPIYSTSRMKWMSKQIDATMQLTVDVMRDVAEKQEPFDMYQVLQGATLDFTMRANFGIRLNCQRDRNDPVLLNLIDSMNHQMDHPLVTLVACFPEFHWLTLPLRKMKDILKYWANYPCTQWMFQQCREIIENRKAEKTHRQPDVLKLMLEDKITLQKLFGRIDESEMADLHLKENYMTFKEMWANASLFLFGGYENISLVLAFTFRFLVNHQDIQDKAREEAKRVLEQEGTLDYNSALKLTYIDQVMNESLRLYPAVNNFTFREAVNDFQYQDIQIPKGTIVLASLDDLGRNPDYWADPLKFDPDRFAPENMPHIDPYIFQPFGIGPRHCLGMRFSQFAVKLAVARLLINYRFVPTDQTPADHGPVSYRLFQIFPKDGVVLKAIPITE